MNLDISDLMFDDEARENTPGRWQRFMDNWLNPEPFNFTTFENPGCDQIIAQTNIQFYSMCSHHCLPFFGMAHIGYIPDKTICGLSKLARTVDYYSRAFQTQEGMTRDIALHLTEKLKTENIIVILQGRHLCMEMRGVQKLGTMTTTSYVGGAFRDGAKQEFLELMKVRQ